MVTKTRRKRRRKYARFKPVDRGPNWQRQADAARKRDKYTCRDCGRVQYQPRLDVHHLIPYRSFNGDYKVANRLSNLISVCRICHWRREGRVF